MTYWLTALKVFKLFSFSIQAVFWQDLIRLISAWSSMSSFWHTAGPPKGLTGEQLAAVAEHGFFFLKQNLINYAFLFLITFLTHLYTHKNIFSKTILCWTLNGLYSFLLHFTNSSDLQDHLPPTKPPIPLLYL